MAPRSLVTSDLSLVLAKSEPNFCLHLPQDDGTQKKEVSWKEEYF